MSKHDIAEASLPHVTIYTDGSWLNKQHAGGWSAMMVCGPYWKLIYDGVMNTTINRMELSAAIAGLSNLNTPCVVNIIADSQLTVNIINHWIYKWRNNGYMTNENRPVCNKDLIEMLYPFLQVHKVYARWIKAHTTKKDLSSLGNDVVDAFAKTGARGIARQEKDLYYLQQKMPNAPLKFN